MMKFSIQEIARLLAAMRAYSIGDAFDHALIERLRYRLAVMKVEAVSELDAKQLDDLTRGLL